MPFPDQRDDRPCDPVERVLAAVRPHLDAQASKDGVRALIAEAMRPKSAEDRRLLGGNGPLTFQQFKGLAERVQGWKGDWLGRYLELGVALTDRRVDIAKYETNTEAALAMIDRLQVADGGCLLRCVEHANSADGDDVWFRLAGDDAPSLLVSSEVFEASKVEGIRKP